MFEFINDLEILQYELEGIQGLAAALGTALTYTSENRKAYAQGADGLMSIK